MFITQCSERKIHMLFIIYGYDGKECNKTKTKKKTKKVMMKNNGSNVLYSTDVSCYIYPIFLHCYSLNLAMPNLIFHISNRILYLIGNDVTLV